MLDNTFFIGSKPIEFVSSFCHLGHVITDNRDDGPDITKRSGDFITIYYVFLASCPLMSKLVCFVHSALATMGASCGTFHIGICLISVLHGVKA